MTVRSILMSLLSKVEEYFISWYSVCIRAEQSVASARLEVPLPVSVGYSAIATLQKDPTVRGLFFYPSMNCLIHSIDLVTSDLFTVCPFTRSL